MMPRPSLRRSFADSGLLFALGIGLFPSTLDRYIGSGLAGNRHPPDEGQNVSTPDPEEPRPHAMTRKEPGIDPLVHGATRDTQEVRDVRGREEHGQIGVSIERPLVTL